MKISNSELVTCVSQMPQDMRQRVIENIESELGMTLTEYKAQQIEAAEALVADIKANPDSYTTAILNNRFSEIVGHFKISPELEQEITRAKRFVSYRSSTVYHTDGTVERREGLSYADYISEMWLDKGDG